MQKELKPDTIVQNNVPDEVVDFCKNLFDFAGKKFAFVKVNDEIYFKGKEIAEFLEYVDTKKAISKNVNEKDKKKLQELWGDHQSPLTYNIY